MSWLQPLCILVGLNMCLCNDEFGTPLSLSSTVNKDMAKTADAQLPSILKRYYPQENHLKVAKLMRRLGDKFDSEWMAVTRPGPVHGNQAHSPDPGLNDALNTREAQSQVHTLLASRNLTADGPSTELLVHFLSSILSSCKVRYEWSDLGDLFWPRFIKSGLCTSEKSCSWPSGMTCLPGKLKMVQILRWRCKRRRSANRKRKTRARKNRQKKHGSNQLTCSWKLIPYHVPVDCECSC